VDDDCGILQPPDGSLPRVPSSRDDAAPGTAHVWERLAFSSTHKRSSLKIQRDVEDAGATVAASAGEGIVQAHARTRCGCPPHVTNHLAATAGRELFALTGEALRDNLDPVLKVLAQAVTEPKLLRWEVEEGKAAMAALIHDLEADPKTTLIEGVHAAAFGATSPLGHSQFAATEDLGDVDETALRSFLAARVKGNNIVVVGNSESLSQRGEGGGGGGWIRF